MLFANYKEFIEKIYDRLSQLGIDINELRIDHIGYQANSTKDYEQKRLLLNKNAELISESIVGERRVGIFTLQESLNYQEDEFSIVEIFEPRKGQKVNSAWEHVEFILNENLEEFMSKYPNIPWDISVINRAEFPMLILNLDDELRAKFPRRGVLEEIKRQILWT